MTSAFISIFTTLKPFSGLAGVIQRNALRNWISLEPRPEVFVFGNEDGVADICEELGLVHIPEVERSEGGKPLLNAMVAGAERKVTGNLLMFSDGDILFHGLTEAAQVAASTFQEFLLVAQRRSISVSKAIDFAKPDWAIVFTDAPILPPCAVDFFLFTKNFWASVPPFAIASYALDNWLIENALARRKIVIDATPVILAYHQNHESLPRAGVDWQHNLELFGGDPTLPRGFVTHAPWVLDENGIRKR